MVVFVHLLHLLVVGTVWFLVVEVFLLVEVFVVCFLPLHVTYLLLYVHYLLLYVHYILLHLQLYLGTVAKLNESASCKLAE